MDNHLSGMSFSDNQISGLKSVVPNLNIVQEGGYTYFYIEKFKLPEGCDPEYADLLYCPTQIQSYPSRLYFSSKIEGCASRNWNGNIRAVGKNWFAFSWSVKRGLTLVQMFSIHLKGLKK